MFQTTNQNSSWCGYRSKMVKTWSKTDWQKWMGLTTKKDPSLWLHDPSPVGLRSLGLEKNWQESTMFSNHEQVWDSYSGVLQYFHSSKSGIHHLHQCPTGRSSLPGSSCTKKKHRRFAFPGHAPKPDGKHQETSGNTFSYKMIGPPICCPSTLSSETGAAPNNLTWQQTVDENHNLLRHLAAAAAAHGFSIVILYQRLS